MSFQMDDYNDVPARIAEFRTKHPEGSLQPANPDQPFQVLTMGEFTFIAYTAAAYRSPEDPRPGIACAYEQFPGRTPYTKGSELQNAETSAWGRAIVAALAADAKKSIATAEEIRNRRAEQQQPSSQPVEPTPKQQLWAFAQSVGMSAEKLGTEFTAWSGSNGQPLNKASGEQVLDFLSILQADFDKEPAA